MLHVCCCAGVVVATIERANMLVTRLLEADSSLPQLGLVVVDELHLLGEDSRGCTLELLLNKLRCVFGSLCWLALVISLHHCLTLLCFEAFLVLKKLTQGPCYALGLVVVDELHLLGADSRGCTLELLLNKLRCVVK